MYQDPEAQTLYSQDLEYKSGTSIRLGFIRKVYGIISFQLLLTSIFVILCQGPLRSALFNPYDSKGNTFPFVLFIICSVVALICMITLACYPPVAKRVPTNYVILSVFTLSEVYVVGYFTVFFEPLDVLLAAVLALSMTIALTLYAWTTKSDFTVYGAALWIAAWALLAFSLLFFWIGRNTPAYTPLTIIICVLAIVVFGFYLVYDTQLLIGGKRYELDVDDYIIAAVIIYVDIIVLFMRLLELISIIRNN